MSYVLKLNDQNMSVWIWSSPRSSDRWFTSYKAWIGKKSWRQT